MQVSTMRQRVRFDSGDAECAAWHYPGTNGACVVMAGGFGVVKEPGTDPFARRFHDAGYGVLAFDYRHFGESGGEPRQVATVRGQLADWDAAIAFAATLPGVDPARIAIWGFSSSGGHILRIAARTPALAAAIAQTPNVDGPAAARNASRHQKPVAMLRFLGRGVLDLLGGPLGRPPLLVPLAGKPGTVALLTTPDSLDGAAALTPARYPGWQQTVSAGSALRFAWYRPARVAAKVTVPLLAVVCNQDRSALAEPAARTAQRAPRGELLRMDGGHYEPFLGGHEQTVAAELAFLGRHVLGGAE